MHSCVERVVDLLDPSTNQLYAVSVEAARELQGSFAPIARRGQTVTTKVVGHA